MALITDSVFDYEVIDMSVPEDTLETPSLDTGLGILLATFSSRGQHNKIIEYRSGGAIKNALGDDFDDFKKYGQPNITAMRVAKSGGRVFICSLIPDNAKVAYSLFGVTVISSNSIPVYKRTDTEISADGTSVVVFGKGSYVLDADGNKQQIKLKENASDEEATILATTSGAELRVETKQIKNNAWFDEDGNPTGVADEPIVTTLEGGGSETFYPLFCIYYYSRGRGGNYFGYKLSRNLDRDKKSTDGRRYSLKFYELLTSGSYKQIFSDEEFNFSFNPDAVFSSTDTTAEGLGLVWTNLMSDGTKRALQMIVLEGGYRSLISAIKLNGGNEEDVEANIDFINGIFQNSNPYNKLVMADDSIDVANTIITLDYGNDGDIDEDLMSPEEIAEEKEKLLVNFFNCDVDDDIFDEKMIDADILPDCNYSDVVKQTIMSEFSQYRPDILLGMDLGIVSSPEQAISRYRELNGYVNTEWSYMCAFYGHAGYLKDAAIDGSPREITCTYDWIAGIADNFSTANGAFQMAAGANRGKVKYLIPYHVCKKTKSNVIEQLEEYGINNIQYINKKKDLAYMLESTQYTIENSKLMSVRNALVIGRLIRMCAGILPYYKYDERNINTTMAEAGGTLAANVGLARIPSTVKVDFELYQTVEDKRSDNAHCKIEVTFPDYVKKFHVVIMCKRPEKE